MNVGELREFLDGVPDKTEVRISSVYNTLTEETFHVGVSDISYDSDYTGEFLVLEPLEIELSEDAGY